MTAMHQVLGGPARGAAFGAADRLAWLCPQFTNDPNEVLTTEEVAQEASRSEIAFEPMGSVELKGFVQPVALHRATVAAVPA